MGTLCQFIVRYIGWIIKIVPQRSWMSTTAVERPRACMRRVRESAAAWTTPTARWFYIVQVDM